MSFKHDSHTLQENNQMYAHHIAGERASQGLRRAIPSCLVGGQPSSLYQSPPDSPLPCGEGSGPLLSSRANHKHQKEREKVRERGARVTEREREAGQECGKGRDGARAD